MKNSLFCLILILGSLGTAQAGVFGARIDEGLIRDTLSISSQSTLKEKLIPALQKAIDQSSARNAIRRIDVRWDDWYSGVRLQENKTGTGVSFSLSADVDFSFLPMGSPLFQRVHLRGPVEIQGDLTFAEGEIRVIEPQVKFGLVLACQQWWPAPLCAELKRQVLRTAEKQVTEFNSKLGDLTLVRNQQLTAVIPILKTPLVMVPKKIKYVAPACASEPQYQTDIASNQLGTSRGWIELQFDLQGAL
jgi:hypothetical protein